MDIRKLLEFPSRIQTPDLKVYGNPFLISPIYQFFKIQGEFPVLFICLNTVGLPRRRISDAGESCVDWRMERYLQGDRAPAGTSSATQIPPFKTR